MEKDLLKKSENDFEYDEFERMLTEFINSEFEAANAEAENKADGDTDGGSETKDEGYSADDYDPCPDAFDDCEMDNILGSRDTDPIRQIDRARTLKPERPLHFSATIELPGDIMRVRVTPLDGLKPDTDRFRCYVYTEDYFPMCSNRKNCNTTRNGNQLTYKMYCRRYWMPGRYVLLVRDKDGQVARMPFELVADSRDHGDGSADLSRSELDQRNRPRDHGRGPLVVIPGELRPVPVFSADDVLVESLADEDAWLRLAAMPGMSQLRRKAIEQHQLDFYNELREELDAEALRRNRNLLICSVGSDMTDRVLSNFRQLTAGSKSLEYVDCATLYDATCNNPYEHLGELAMVDRVVCLAGLGALLTTGGKVIVKRLVERVRESSCILWLCGSRSEIETLFEQFPSLKAFFTADSWVAQERSTAFELVQAFFACLDAEHLEPTPEVRSLVAETIQRGYSEGRLTGWTLGDIERLVEDDIRPRYVRRMLSDVNVYWVPKLSEADIDTSRFGGSGESLEQIMAGLNEMVGLDEVKRGITTMANNTRFTLERRRRGLPTSAQVPYHAIFTGNPGTGKTTVARQLGRIYHALGLLSKGEVVAVDRTRLVGRYIGETEENMKAVLEEARGNVLFIDEAYNLYDGAGDRKDFGARVIDSLLTVLAQPNPDMMVVFAGYEKEMDAMLNTNPGLTGRFPYKYKFEDYNADQLMEIAERLLLRDAYILEGEACELLRRNIEHTLSQPTRNFGNARWVEQYVAGGILPAMADRLATTGGDDYQRITVEDVRKGYEKFNPKATELKPRRQVGFSA